MIRLLLLSLFIFILSVYAWKDWYRSLCGMVLMMAVIEHPDMPKAIFEIQGLNPWNIGFFCVFLAWLSSRGREGLAWDMPRKVSAMLLLYGIVVVVSFGRMMADRYALEYISTGGLVSEYLVNTIKWVIPGLMFFDGCRSQERFKLGLLSLLGLYLLLGLQVIRWMPLDAATTGESMSTRSLKILSNEIGYHRVNLSMMLAGASWAMLATLPLSSGGMRKTGIICAGIMILFAQALTGGRAGYVTWAAVGFILCTIRWRKYLLLMPIVIVAVAVAAPSVVERMSQGFSPDSRKEHTRVLQDHDETDPDSPDMYTITAGRNIAWPVVLRKIGESPVFGYGRLAMQRTGINIFLLERYGERFGHPHSAYLEMLLDNGIVGFLLVFPFYAVIVRKSISLFRDSRSPVFIAIGGVTLSLVLALLVASFASQTFYPREGAVGMWCAIGLSLRVWVQRSLAIGEKGVVQDAGTLWGGKPSATGVVLGVEPA